MTHQENRAAAAAQLKQVQERIEQWRSKRCKKTPVPPEIWQQATELAAELGVYQVSRALRLSYDGLRHRVNRQRLSSGTAQSVAGGFIELGGAQLLGASAPAAAIVVEVTDQRGGRLSVRISAQQSVDVVALVDRFLEAR